MDEDGEGTWGAEGDSRGVTRLTGPLNILVLSVLSVHGRSWYIHSWPFMAQPHMAVHGTSAHGRSWHIHPWPFMAHPPMAVHGTSAHGRS